MCFLFSTVSTLGVLFPYLVTGLLAENWEPIVNQPVLLWNLYTSRDVCNASRRKVGTKGSAGPEGLVMGKRDLSPTHEEFIAGTELAVGESPLLLLLANVSAASCAFKAYQSVPDNFPALPGRCWRTGHGNGAPCLCPRMVQQELVLAWPCTRLSVGEGCGELPCCCRPHGSSRRGSRDRDRTHESPLWLCALNRRTDRSRHLVLGCLD